MNKQYGIYMLVAAVLVLAGVVFFTNSTGEVSIAEPLGAISGTDTYDTITFGADLVEGGITATSSPGTTGVLPLSAFDTEEIVAMTLTSADLTLTMPASSTMAGFLPRAGMKKTFTLVNAGANASLDITIAGNTGTLLKSATTTTRTILGDTDSGNHANISIMRLPSGNFAVSLEAVKQD